MNKIVVGVLLIIMSLHYVSAQNVEQDFQQVQNAFDQRASNAQHIITAYLTNYPYTPYADEAYAMQGILLTETGKYEQAVKTLNNVKVKHLSRTSAPLYCFHMGYAYFQLGDNDKALVYLQKLNKKANPYSLQTTYYIGCCHYNKKEYEQALVEFLSLEQIGGYRQIAPYYIVQIHYALEEYDKVQERAEELLVKYPDNEYSDELHRMLGEIYYQDEAYEQAASHLDAYYKSRLEKKTTILRNDLYLLGISNYRITQYSKAIDYLKEVKQELDSISESTYLHLGHCYLRMNDLEQAKLAYAAAIQFNLNPALREEAMYNYVQVTYLQNSALGESITAFQNFIQEYPTSKHIDQIYTLMADLYLNTKNYKASYNALMEIQKPNNQILETRQYLRYQLAADAFLQDKMSEVLQWANELITNEYKTSRYKTEAYYLCAQAKYRMHQYDACLEQLDLYEKQPNSTKSQNHIAAVYLKAYALFNQQNFIAAEPIFRTYIQKISPDNNTYADALNRIGDCLFQSRKFHEASETYAQVVALNKVGTDYAILQQGYALGLLHRYQQKVETLKALPMDYPQSDFADDALYETARAELQQSHTQQAIEAYLKLLKQYPNSDRATKASLELGMAYRTLKQNDLALEAFKNTISTYPNCEEAYSALEGIEQIYVETNNVNEYIDYTKTLSNINMQNISSEDSLVYVSAELQYMMGNYQQAIAGFNTYLTSFCPGGRYCAAASYYAANSFYQLKQYDNAIEQYSALADIQGNPYMETACMRVAELCFNKQEYRTALYYFQRMSDAASSTSKRSTALLGMLRCSNIINEYTTTIDVATQMLEQHSLDSIVRNEALFCRAKAYIHNQQYASALHDLTPVANEVRTAQGAEAKYLIAECHFNLQDLDKAEQEIMSFTQQQTTQQYWLAKSLLLLSDINVLRKELFKAKQYLLALQKNYHVQDDIQTIILDKLQHIEQLEIQQINDTTQIQQL